MEEINPQNLIGKTKECYLIQEVGSQVARVTPEFYKNVATSTAIVRFCDEKASELERYHINSKWMFESVPTDPLSVIYGSYEYGRGHHDFMLHFDIWNNVDEFRTMFNKCIKDENAPRKIYAEQQLEALDIRSDRHAYIVADEGNVDRNSMLEVLRGENHVIPQNLYVRPHHRSIKTFTCNRTVGVSNAQFANYFDVYEANAPKKHWRGHPGVRNALPLEKRVQGDPILQIERYTFQTPADNRTRRTFQPVRGGHTNARGSSSGHQNPLANL